jgi:hypothetical protein
MCRHNLTEMPLPKTLPTDPRPSAGNATTRLRLILSLLIPVILFLSRGAGATPPPDSAGDSPPVIDSIDIRPGNVFDLSNPEQNNLLFRLADRTHIVTRKSVIRRELLVREGDVYDTALVNESIRNLRSLPYLLNVDIHMEIGSHGEHIMVVETTDKWSAYPRISYMRSGGRNDLRLGIKESNFLGYGIEMGHRYYILDRDRDYYLAEFFDNRVMNYDYSVYFLYSDNPQAGQVAAVLGRPFYSLEQNWGGQISYTHLRRRLDFYVAQYLSAQERYNRDNLLFQMTYRVGGDKIKYHITPKYEYTSLRPRGRNIYVADVDTLLPKPAKDTISHYLELGIRVQQINYAVFRRINRFFKPEDINLGMDARAMAGAAYEPGFRHSQYQYLAVWPQYTFSLGPNLCIAGIRGDQWFAEGEKIRRDINSYFIYYGQYLSNNTLAIRASYNSIHLKEKSYTLYLDEDSGVRGYPAYSFNGEDRFLLTIENRYFSNIEILTVGLGAAAFVDIGNIWARDGSPSLRDTRYSMGFGLRFGVSRSTNAEVVRFDLAYAPERGRWEISVGTGQYF